MFGIAAFLYVFFLPQGGDNNYTKENHTHFIVSLSGNHYGVVESQDEFYELLSEVRTDLIKQSGSKAYVDFPTYEFEAVLDTVPLTSKEDMKTALYAGLTASVSVAPDKSCMIKVGDNAVYVSSAESAMQVLSDGLEAYDDEVLFQLSLANDTSTSFNSLTPVIQKREVVEALESETNALRLDAGVAELLTVDSTEAKKVSNNPYDQFDYGVTELAFAEKIRMAEGYVSPDKIMEPEEARGYLFDLQEMQQIYTVKSGDTLSGISVDVGIPLTELIALNDSLENEHTMIHNGQELLITVPEPFLSVYRIEEVRRQEAFDLPTEYVYNDSWYTSDRVTLRQPSQGFRDAVALVKYENDEIIAEEILYEETLIEGVAKLSEVGTIVPPTYLKPLAGGRISSYFGYRKSPGGFGSTYHKGIDWATPIGTPIMASCGGMVTQAGWSGGYGYCIVLKHPDGKQTRYAHLSRVGVSVGQQVGQGQTIGYSGNSGNSTGPHLHFEIIVGGNQVNPFDYIN